MFGGVRPFKTFPRFQVAAITLCGMDQDVDVGKGRVQVRA